MEIDDRYVTAAPEGMHLEVVLAGLGSRFAAYAVDLVIQGITYVALLFGLGAIFSALNVQHPLLLGGIEALLAILVFFGYWVAFEMLWSGRTPGKRVVGLRVVKTGGFPIGFWSSFIRTFGRLVDALPALNLVGIVMILATRYNQRLGDVLAGTLVIRERVTAQNFVQGVHPFSSGAAFGGGASAPSGSSYAPPGAPWLPPELAHWDASALPPQELQLLLTFLSNRGGYTPEARQKLAVELANRVWPYVAGPAVPPPPETFLEMVAHVKAVRG